MEHKRNPNYGKATCFHCLLSPSGNDPIFIGINRLVAKGLEVKDKSQRNIIQYPCSVVNRFECPYDYKQGKVSDIEFDVEDLFELANMTFAVEISLAIARKTLPLLKSKINKIFIKR
jgi:hypothetical protein